VSDDEVTTARSLPVQGQPRPQAAHGTAATSDRPVPSGRLRLLLLTGVTIASVSAIAAAAACAPSAAPAGPTTPTATTGAPVPASNGPVITSFQIIDDVSCSGSPVSVPVSWSTRDAQTVKFEVDRQPLSAGADRPLAGVGQVALPCDGREHEVVLVASGAGTRVSVARQVNTSTAPPPANAPTISRFDLLDDVTCTGATVDVPAAWLTQNAQAVNFSVDGQPLPAAAGFPASGAGDIAVPCDGNAHKVTLTATGTGPAAAVSRSVNTSASASGGSTASTSPTSPTAGPAPTTSTTR
jgi:hypothetical protein